MPDAPPMSDELRALLAEPGNARAFLDFVSETGDEYAGLPMPLDGTRLVIHPSYRYADVFKAKPEPGDEEIEQRYEIVNQWASPERGRDWVIFRDKETGRRHLGAFPFPNRAWMQMHTLSIASAWELTAERKATEKLATLLSHEKFRTYLLTGAFLETSPRSGIIYLFRRLRPTVAISTANGEARILCGLCLHPIGYYAETWAGCLVPTDEVVAHLMLMRGDEADFWRQANQHPAWHPASGL